MRKYKNKLCKGGWLKIKLGEEEVKEKDFVEWFVLLG